MKIIASYLYLVFIGLISYFITGLFIAVLELIFPPIITLLFILSMMFFPMFWGKVLISSYGYILTYVLFPTLRTFHSLYIWVKAPVYQPHSQLTLEN